MTASSVMVQRILEALTPFMPEQLTIETYANPDFNTQIFVVEIPGLGDEYTAKVALDRRQLLDYTEEELGDFLGRKFAQHYLGIIRIEPAVNIHLGEE